jgi:hypothetical protein
MFILSLRYKGDLAVDHERAGHLAIMGAERGGTQKFSGKGVTSREL